MIASIMEAHGYRVGLFTSPHLENFTERIKINGEEIPPAIVAKYLNEISEVFNDMLELPEPLPLRFFDIVTVMAFQYFADQKVDYAVIEVGLGGRLDATNIIEPEVSVITNIGYEHTNILGETLTEIAFEKAGIIKPNSTLVTSENKAEVLRVFTEKADSLNTKLVQVQNQTSTRRISSDLDGQTFSLMTPDHQYPELYIPLIGRHQILNASTAVMAVEAMDFPILKEAVVEGLNKVRWPGRLEVVYKHPLLVLDCAKDAEATAAATEAIRENFSYDRIIAIVSISSDKKIPLMIKNIAQIAEHFILTTHSVERRAADPEYLGEEVLRSGRTFEIHENQSEALDKALMLAGENDMVLVIGSVYLVGDIRSLIKSRAS
jgi:dihydrofolate synthase/folylpolyglutamate synthase